MEEKYVHYILVERELPSDRQRFLPLQTRGIMRNYLILTNKKYNFLFKNVK